MHNSLNQSPGPSLDSQEGIPLGAYSGSDITSRGEREIYIYILHLFQPVLYCESMLGFQGGARTRVYPKRRLYSTSELEYLPSVLLPCASVTRKSRFWRILTNGQGVLVKILWAEGLKVFRLVMPQRLFDFNPKLLVDRMGLLPIVSQLSRRLGWSRWLSGLIILDAEVISGFGDRL